MPGITIPAPGTGKLAISLVKLRLEGDSAEVETWILASTSNVLLKSWGEALRESC